MSGAAAVPVKTESPWWRAPWDFAVHALVGTLIFIVIALAAVAIELVVRAVEIAGVNRAVTFGLRVGEFTIFAADLLMFIVFIWRTTARTLKGME
jgi:hypothetical protein